jgi:hypothetical protein
MSILDMPKLVDSAGKKMISSAGNMISLLELEDLQQEQV